MNVLGSGCVRAATAPGPRWARTGQICIDSRCQSATDTGPLPDFERRLLDAFVDPASDATSRRPHDGNRSGRPALGPALDLDGAPHTHGAPDLGADEH